MMMGMMRHVRLCLAGRQLKRRRRRRATAIGR